MNTIFNQSYKIQGTHALLKNDIKLNYSSGALILVVNYTAFEMGIEEHFY